VGYVLSRLIRARTSRAGLRTEEKPVSSYHTLSLLFSSSAVRVLFYDGKLAPKSTCNRVFLGSDGRQVKLKSIAEEVATSGIKA
jgi:hypothetical protein